MNVVELPTFNYADIANGLRDLAASIESGGYGAVSGAVWVIRCGDKAVEVGSLGLMQSPGPESYFLLGLAQRKLEDIL